MGGEPEPQRLPDVSQSHAEEAPAADGPAQACSATQSADEVSGVSPAEETVAHLADKNPNLCSMGASTAALAQDGRVGQTEPAAAAPCHAPAAAAPRTDPGQGLLQQQQQQQQEALIRQDSSSSNSNSGQHSQQQLQLPGPAAPACTALPVGPGLYRLKVVGIPPGYPEEQLRSLFQLCGSVAEARIVHDKQSGRPVGYGYVSFSSKEAADLAISTFDDQLQLQGGATCLSVYYAKKQHDASNAATPAVLPGGARGEVVGPDGASRESCPARNAKLYFCGTPAGVRRDSILGLFSAYGRVRHLQVYTDNYGVLSSGTVTMYSTEEAIAAMDSLDGKVLPTGTAPLKVTWAQLSTLPRRSPSGGGPPPPMPRGFTVSYACLPTSVTPAEIAATFERYGGVLQVVPFAHRREGPPGSRGCGLVVLDSEAAAAAAVEGLSGKLTWPGAERPLLVQPFYGAERGAPQGMQGGGGGGGMGPMQGGTPLGQPARGGGVLGAGGPRGPTNHGMAASAGPRAPRPQLHPHMQHQQHQHQQQQHGQPYGGQGGAGGVGGGGAGGALDPCEPPPLGCAPDAFKLLLTNLPASYSQADVVALLQPYGALVSLLHLPAGERGPDSAAMVWYATGGQADTALAALSNTVLMAEEGARQLSLRAFKGRPGTRPAAAPLLQGPGAAAAAAAGAAGGAAMWAPAAGGGGHGHSHGGFAYQQQQQHGAGMLAGGQHMGQGAAPQVLQGELAGMWLQAASSTAPVATMGGMPAPSGWQHGSSQQLAALAAVTAGMASHPGAYSMQQMLSALPSQQQQQQQQMLGAAQGGVGAWPGGAGASGMVLSSGLESAPGLAGMCGGTDPFLAMGGPAVSTAPGMLAPGGSGGAGHVGWF